MSSYTKTKAYINDTPVAYETATSNKSSLPESPKRLDEVASYLFENNQVYDLLVGRLHSVAVRLDPYGGSESGEDSDGVKGSTYPFETIFTRLATSRDLNSALSELVTRLERI